MFSDLSLGPRLIKALDELKFSEPTPVQEQAIPLALAGKDLLVSAATGSGKTAAFMLPILQRLIDDKPLGVATRALILLPTRELARQTMKQFSLLAKYVNIEAGLITGGESYNFQASTIRKNPEIIISTPGRCAEHILRKTIELDKIEMLVLDEADRMLDMGMSEDVLSITEQCNPERQTMLFSATMAKRGLSTMTAKVLCEPERLVLETAKDQHTNIKQQIITIDDVKHKERLCAWLLANVRKQKAIIFTNTKLQAQQLSGIIRYHKQRAAAIHGDLTQDERNKVMQNLRNGAIDVLIATDVAARGIDVKDVDLVINFDIPRAGDDYVHRIGRTGRAGSEGTAISLVGADEWNLMAGISRYIRVDMEQITVKAHEGKYKGPKSVKSNGKVATTKKRKPKDDAKPKGKSRPKVKVPKKVAKPAKPKREKPVTTNAAEDSGFAAFKKKR